MRTHSREQCLSNFSFPSFGFFSAKAPSMSAMLQAQWKQTWLGEKGMCNRNAHHLLFLFTALVSTPKERLAWTVLASREKSPPDMQEQNPSPSIASQTPGFAQHRKAALAHLSTETGFLSQHFNI